MRWSVSLLLATSARACSSVQPGRSSCGPCEPVRYRHMPLALAPASSVPGCHILLPAPSWCHSPRWLAAATPLRPSQARAAAKMAASMNAPAGQSFKRIEVNGVHPTMRTKVVGQEEILMHEPLSDTAKCLDFSISQLTMCQWSWGWCFWEDKMKPRSYVQVTENSFEYNFPNMLMCPLDMCVKDNTSKIYFDKMLTTEPYKAQCGTPYHTCCCLALCGDVMVIAPHPAMANCCCMGMAPCLYKMYPGLQDAQALADYVKVARDDFAVRKGLKPGGVVVGMAQAAATE